jgi:hypothetical protein
MAPTPPLTEDPVPNCFQVLRALRELLHVACHCRYLVCLIEIKAKNAFFRVFASADECCHPSRFRVELVFIEDFEIGRLDFPKRDTPESTHCFLPNQS